MDALVALVARQHELLDNCIDASHVLFQAWGPGSPAKTANIIREIQISLGFMRQMQQQIAEAAATLAPDAYNQTVAGLLTMYAQQVGRVQALSRARIQPPRQSSVPKATFLAALLQFQLNFHVIDDAFPPRESYPRSSDKHAP